MVASAIFITDLTGKPLISRNYRGDIPLTAVITGAAAFTTTSSSTLCRSSSLNLGKEGNVDFGGNA